LEDAKEYIESGILELYVLGELSPEERLQVEDMAAKHAAVKAELDDIGQAMTMYADANAIEPDEALRNRVLNSLLTNLADDRNFKSATHEAPVVPLTTQNKSTVSIFYKYAFAASLLLLCVSVAALSVVYKKLNQSQDQLLSLRLSEQKYSRQVSLMDNELNVYRDPAFQFIRLKGTPKTPASVLTVAWNPARKKVMVDMHNAKLPETDPNHQYQLWAIANGKPVDLGVFDKLQADSVNMKEMKDIAVAQAFAVTIEPRGGSANPTMDQMVVIASL
jgi:anti-sigma-K factor RskA